MDAYEGRKPVGIQKGLGEKYVLSKGEAQVRMKDLQYMDRGLGEK
jgi:hypothetical protein